ncbi:uncharacterized protein LOC132549543 [Ylistrum balloti]|uniref:uncharacterized protein LOC132549543 n=1 Tax=Ylistrum balloti TaxID=509963 RepID=UPI002905C73C|nr:uncharacterized protein LOC132549543 [Ylistrum balloti]
MVSISFNIGLICYIYFGTCGVPVTNQQSSRAIAKEPRKTSSSISNQKFINGLQPFTLLQSNVKEATNINTTYPESGNHQTTPVKVNIQKESRASNRVYNWNGHSWKENKTVCENLPQFRQETLRTRSGDTPIFIHEPGVDKYISQTVLVSGTWEREVAVAVVSFLQADKDLQFLDIGANIGVISLEVAKLGRRVVSVEPLIDNVQRLCSSFRAGHFPSDTTIVFNAVSDIHERVALGRDQDNVGGTFVLNNNPNKRNGSDVNLIGQYRELVNTALLDDLLSLLSSDPLTKVVIKLDVEGYEDHVLNGADEFFHKVDVQAVIMEWTYSKQPGTAETIQLFMSRHNMYPYDFNQRALELTPRAKWPPNIVWLKEKRKPPVNKDETSSAMVMETKESQTRTSHEKMHMGIRPVTVSNPYEKAALNIYSTTADSGNHLKTTVNESNSIQLRDLNRAVYSWNGHTWKENKTVCENLPRFRQGTLRTFSGDTPIFIHEPGVDKYISQTVLLSGTFEQEVALAVVFYLQADKDLQFLDIGANIGVISLEVAKLGRRVVSVEPLIDNVQRLCSSFRAGQFPSDTTIVFNAVSDIHERVALGRDQDNVGGTFVLNNNPNKRNGSDVTLIGQYRELVNTALLDDLLSLLSSNPLTKVVIKLDVEGYEDHVLNGADEFFHKVDVQAVIMEWTYSKQPGTATTIQLFMSRHNMYPYDFNQRTLDFTPSVKWPANIVWLKQHYNERR